MPKSATRAIKAGVVDLVAAKPNFGGVFPLGTPGSTDGVKPRNFFLFQCDIMFIGKAHQPM
jgi:hypothetical protein